MLGGAGVYGGVAGVAQSLTVYVRDTYDNPVASNPANGVAVPVYSDEALTNEVDTCELIETPGESGQLTATYTLTDTGSYWIAPKVDGVSHRGCAVQA